MGQLKHLAIDPGDDHVGYAYDGNGGVIAGEWTPAEACENVALMATRNQIDELILEEFVLYEKDIRKQAWSKLQTSQLIGALKLIAHWFRIPVIEQGAYIKKPTRAQIRARGIKQVGGVIHALDAELHLWYRALREKKEEEQS